MSDYNRRGGGLASQVEVTVCGLVPATHRPKRLSHAGKAGVATQVSTASRGAEADVKCTAVVRRSFSKGEAHIERHTPREAVLMESAETRSS